MSRYMFVDGNYLRQQYERAMDRFYNTVPPMAHVGISGIDGGGCSRFYYYDAIDRTPREGESPEATAARITEREQLHSYLNSLPNWHVREGYVSSGRKKQQKAVDVKLAVDALEHAQAKNITAATFVLGDLDFEPLLAALNRLGVQILIVYERETTNPALLETADLRVQLTLQHFYGLAVPSFRERYQPPTFSVSQNSPMFFPQRSGRWKGREIVASAKVVGQHPCELFVPSGRELIEPALRVFYEGGPLIKLETAFTMTYGGEIVWNS